MDDDLLDVLPAGVVLTADATAAGVHSDALRRGVRAGVLTRIRPGAYLRTVQWSGATPEARHRAVVEAVARQLRDPVFSHESAAVLWGLPLVGAADAVHVLGPARRDGSRRGSGAGGGVVRHAAPPTTVIERCGGLRTTGVAATVAALAAARDLRDVLPVADRALRDGLTTVGALRDAVAAGSRRGSRRAMTAVVLADGRSESVGESVSRARIHLDGLAAPRLQVGVRDAGGVFARVDFCWPDQGVVGEFDGRVKYRVDALPEGRAVEERLWAEKQREDRIRALGLRVVRWTWADARRPGPLAARLRAAGVPRR